MTGDSALHHRSCQSVSLTDQSCRADNSLTGSCNVEFENLLLAQWPATVHYNTDSAKVPLTLIRAALQTTA